MQVVLVNEVLTSISKKGQVTIPKEIREKLGIKPKDKIAFRAEKGKIRIIPLGSPIEASFQAVPALKRKVSLEQMIEIAAEEHALHAAREGL